MAPNPALSPTPAAAPRRRDLGLVAIALSLAGVPACMAVAYASWWILFASSVHSWFFLMMAFVLIPSAACSWGLSIAGLALGAVALERNGPDATNILAIVAGSLPTVAIIVFLVFRMVSRAI